MSCHLCFFWWPSRPLFHDVNGAFWSISCIACRLCSLGSHLSHGREGKGIPYVNWATVLHLPTDALPILLTGSVIWKKITFQKRSDHSLKILRLEVVLFNNSKIPYTKFNMIRKHIIDHNFLQTLCETWISGPLQNSTIISLERVTEAVPRAA